jgi:hypothetical protein
MQRSETVEIAGVKYEVLIDEARRIESFRVGDTIKVLQKEYNDTYKSSYGVILGFDDFKDFPNIQVALLSMSYNSAVISIVDINPSTEKDNKYRICKVAETDLLIDKTEVLRLMDREIEGKKREMDDMLLKKKYFNERFQAYFRRAGEA